MIEQEDHNSDQSLVEQEANEQLVHVEVHRPVIAVNPINVGGWLYQPPAVHLELPEEEDQDRIEEALVRNPLRNDPPREEDLDENPILNNEQNLPEENPPPGYHEVVNDNLNDPQPEHEMEIAAAIRDLLRQHDARTNQIINDNREALTLQMNAQQDVLDQLVARIVAPGPPPAQPPINVAVPVRAILGSDLSYDGRKGEAVVIWLQE